MLFRSNHLSSDQSLVLLEPGRIYGLSNAALDSPWPKLLLGVQLVTNLGEEKAQNPEESFLILTNKQKEDRELLRPSGLATMEDEYQLSSIFVEHPSQAYGTRTSSILQILSQQHNEPISLLYLERSFESPGFQHYTQAQHSVSL